jgi:hypothetical protein
MPATQTAAGPARLTRVPLHQIRLSPPPLRTAGGHDLEPRRVSWVELFFDLVFAGAVNQLAGALQDHPSLTTLAHFAFFFVPVWWLWVQFSFYADRHESGCWKPSGSTRPASFRRWVRRWPRPPGSPIATTTWPWPKRPPRS